MNPQKLFRSLFTIALVIVVTGIASPLSAQEVPQVPEVVKQHLWPLVGNWKGDATMTIGGTTLSFKLTHKSTKTAAGFGVHVVDEATIPGFGDYTGTNLFGYDASTGTLHMFTVASGGEVHDHAGKWNGESTVVLRYEGTMDGKPMVEIITLNFEGPRQYSFSSVVTVGGEPFQTFAATMKR